MPYMAMYDNAKVMSDLSKAMIFRLSTILLMVSFMTTLFSLGIPIRNETNVVRKLRTTAISSYSHAYLDQRKVDIYTRFANLLSGSKDCMCFMFHFLVPVRGARVIPGGTEKLASIDSPSGIGTERG